MSVRLLRMWWYAITFWGLEGAIAVLGMLGMRSLFEGIWEMRSPI
ncbi:hypothetical protein [Sphaerospermopsis sp. LEGE 08334]|nr:hypothetical protein [Sphaerospermopsis sp. LEGE 08334]